VWPKFVFQVYTSGCFFQSTSPPSNIYRRFSTPGQKEACRELAIDTAQNQGATCQFY